MIEKAHNLRWTWSICMALPLLFTLLFIMVIVIHSSCACGCFEIKRSVNNFWFIRFVQFTKNFMCLLLCFMFFKKVSNTRTHTHMHTGEEQFKIEKKTTSAISYSENSNRSHQERDGCFIRIVRIQTVRLKRFIGHFTLFNWVKKKNWKRIK